MDKNQDIDRLSSKEPLCRCRAPLLAGLIITLLALIIYLPTLNAPFVLDDEANITSNMMLRDMANFWPPSGSRYLAHLTFAINYYLGGLQPRGYHLVNTSLHILSGLTLYGIVRAIFLTPAMQKGGEVVALRYRGPVALLSAVIFTAHPLNTQAVIYITQRFTVMASLLYLLSVYLYLKYRRGAEDKGQSGPYPIVFYLLSILAALGAAKTKEISLTLPVVIVLLEYVFFTEPHRWISRRRLLSLLPYALVLIIIPLAVLGPELGLWAPDTVVGNGLTRAQQIRDIKELSSYSYLLTQFTVLPKYIRLFFLPLWQNLDYDYPLYHSFLNLRVMAGFLFLLITFALAFLTARQARRTERPLLLLAAAGIMWFFITLSVESTVLPIRDVIFEHRMYLPGAGLCLGLSVFIVNICAARQKSIRGKALIITALLIIMPLSILSIKRGLLWSSNQRLLEDVVQKSPKKARAHNNLGVFYEKSGKLDKAIVEFRETIALEPEHPLPYKNLSRVLHKSGDTRGAVEALRPVLDSNPGDLAARAALAAIYRDEGFLEKSEKEYKILLTLLPDDVGVRSNLANIFALQGRFPEAAGEYKEILRLRPDMAAAYYYLGLALERGGSAGEALYYYRKFIELAPATMGELRKRVLGRIEELSRSER